MAAVETICLEKKEIFLDVSPSARTVTWRIEEMSENIKSRQADWFEDLRFFIDDSTDTTDTVPLAVFTRGLNEDFHVVENFVQLIPIKGTTTRADILKAWIWISQNWCQ